MARTSPGGLDELSRTLRQLREAPGRPGGKLTLHQVADLAGEGFSTAKISRIERGQNLPTPKDVRTLTRIYQAPPDVAARLVHLAEVVKAATRRIVVPRRPDRAAFQRQLGEIERASEQIREFSPIIVPGFLQTAEYIWALWNTGGGSREKGAEFVTERLNRQAILDADPDRRRITILTTEGALGWAAGPPEMMARQIDHIAALSRKASLRIGIIPFGAEASVFPVSSWSLYDERVAVPGILNTQMVLNDPDVAPYVEQFDYLAPLAAFDGDARAILVAVGDRYRTM